ncbi:hypothetical protein MKX01_036569 [Papaver californicum]|nr:hypothetical protein MKX01_036569 [Papaver californicum]
MLDSANFVLASRKSADNLWESFKNPIDTILPTHIMEANSAVYSRQTKTNYLKGRFRMMSITGRHDFDGVFTQYSHPRRKNGEQRWSTVWSVPNDICRIGGGLGSGACRYNSDCLLTSDLRPRCECPPKFVFVDPNNRYRPDFVQGRQLEEWKTTTDSFELETLEDIDWPTSDYEMLESYSKEQCRTSCLKDCLCDTATVRAGNCWKKKLPLSNGRFSNSMNGKALIKVRRDNSSELGPYSPLSPGEKKDRSTFIVVGSLLLGA